LREFEKQTNQVNIIKSTHPSRGNRSVWRNPLTGFATLFADVARAPSTTPPQNIGLACVRRSEYIARQTQLGSEVTSRNYPLNEALARFAKRAVAALAWAPNRVLHVCEAVRPTRRRGAATLGDLLADFAEMKSDVGADDTVPSRTIRQTRLLGLHFSQDDDFSGNR
jgi:hypothetical protein